MLRLTNTHNNSGKKNRKLYSCWFCHKSAESYYDTYYILGDSVEYSLKKDSLYLYEKNRKEN